MRYLHSCSRQPVSSYANGPDDAVNDKCLILRAELDDIRGRHNNQRQIGSLQDSIDMRVNLEVAKAKAPLRTVAEVEARAESSLEA